MLIISSFSTVIRWGCHQRWTGYYMWEICPTRSQLKKCMTSLENMELYDKFECKFAYFTISSLWSVFSLLVTWTHLHFSGTTTETKGTAYIVYEDIFDAKNACDHLSGFNVCNRYLVVLYYNPNRVSHRRLGAPLGGWHLCCFCTYFICWFHSFDISICLCAICIPMSLLVVLCICHISEYLFLVL